MTGMLSVNPAGDATCIDALMSLVAEKILVHSSCSSSIGQASRALMSTCLYSVTFFIFTIFSITCFNVMGTMTAQSNTLHKLSIHQIHSAFRLRISVSEFLTVPYSWITEKDLQSFHQQGRLLLVSFYRLEKPQRCFRVTHGNNSTQICTDIRGTITDVSPRPKTLQIITYFLSPL